MASIENWDTWQVENIIPDSSAKQVHEVKTTVVRLVSWDEIEVRLPNQILSIGKKRIKFNNQWNLSPIWLRRAFAKKFLWKHYNDDLDNSIHYSVLVDDVSWEDTVSFALIAREYGEQWAVPIFLESEHWETFLVLWKLNTTSTVRKKCSIIESK